MWITKNDLVTLENVFIILVFVQTSVCDIVLKAYCLFKPKK